MASDDNQLNFFLRLSSGFLNMLEAPGTYIREKIVLPNRGEPYPWYHMKYRRVPDIDSCYVDDHLCVYEAEEQFTRDRKVDTQIVRILRRRRDECLFLEQHDYKTRCAKVTADFDQAELNLFIKYGDMGIRQSAQEAYMKQKHRLVIERRRAQNYTPRPPKYIDRDLDFNYDDR